MSRFSLTVVPAATGDANLLILHQDDDTTVILAPHLDAPFTPDPDAQTLFRATVSWGGTDNPLFAALPPVIRHSTTHDPELAALVTLICAEHQADRCGVASVLNRMTEIVIVKLLRGLLETGTVQTGMLGGLSDPRLSRAMVAMHDDPGRRWTTEDMAQVAGLSLSRFAELFRTTVGMTPSAYLRQWRLVLARQDIARGDRIDAVARRYGYGSSEALNHMVRRISGHSPMQIRKAATRSETATPAT